MESIRKHYKEIDSLKGLAIFLVVLGHAIIYFPINLHENTYCEGLFKILSSVHLPLFFVISGFCFSYHGNYGAYVLKKIKRLIVPYFVFNLLDLLPRAMFPQFVNRSRGITESVIDMLLYGGEYWFLFALFMIFLIYPAIYKWQEESRTRKAVILLLSLVLAIKKLPTEVFVLSSVSYYLFYFNLGVVLKLCNIRIFELELSKCHIFLPTVLSVLWITLLFSPWSHPVEILTALIGITVCYFFTRLNAFNDIFKHFGKFSLQIYLLNGFLLVISRTIICSVSDAPVVIIFFNMIVDFVCSYLVIRYICNRIPIVKVLMGIS